MQNNLNKLNPKIQQPRQERQPVAFADGAGLTSAISGGGSMGPQVVGGTGQVPPPPTPGVTGITPGAVERRLDGGTPSQGLGMGAGPDLSRFSNPGMFRNRPDQLGPGRGEVSAPVGNIQQFLQTLQQRNQQGRQ